MGSEINQNFEPSGFFVSETDTEKLFANVIEVSIDGGMCVVGKFLLHGKWHIIKRLKPEFLENTIYNTSLEKEFEIGIQLDHPNIIRYLHKGKDKKGLFIIQEYLDGISLREAIQKRDNFLNKKNIEKIIHQLISAIDYLHKHQIYHLDLKPENILLSHKGQNIKIIDFGLAITDCFEGIASGTKKYAPPEQLKAPLTQGSASDIYSFGLLILELFTGSINKERIKELPPHYRKVIKSCIDESYKNRPENIIEVEDGILKYHKKRRKLFLAIGIAVTIGITSVFLFYSSLEKNNNTVKNIAPMQNTTNNLKEEIKSSAPINEAISKQTPVSEKENNPVSKEMVTEYKKSQTELGKTNNMINKILADTIFSSTDSLKIVGMTNDLYQRFKNRVTKYDQHPYYQNRPRKLVILDIKDSCYRESLKLWIAYTKQFNNEAMKLYHLDKMHTVITKRVKLKIDSIAWNNGVPN